MRMEMPERRSDLFVPGTDDAAWSLRVYLGERPRALASPRVSAATSRGHGAVRPAECLYLIVTLAGGEDARRSSPPDEVADTDGNGLPEFIDGWGRPIFFLRWAPGFNDSDLQPNIFSAADASAAAQQDHDPFDTRKS